MTEGNTYDIGVALIAWQIECKFGDTFSFLTYTVKRLIQPRKLHHTQASLLLRNGTPIADVSRRLGHDSVDLTYRVYSHFIQGDDSKTAETWASATEPDQPYEGTPLCRVAASPEISRPAGPRLAQAPKSLAQTRKEVIGNTQ